MDHFYLSFQTLLLCSALCLQWTSALDPNKLPTAVDITWSSINFKTILEWKPKPVNYFYTVEVSGTHSNWKKRCKYSSGTECDLTSFMENVHDTYTARVISELPGDEEIHEEYPFSESPPFTPYEQTILGMPVIESFDIKDDKLHVLVKDPVTPYFSNGSFKTVGDIFEKDYIYTLFYRKASSTGKKQESSDTNEIVISVEKGESYCFFVRSTVPSRKLNRHSQDSNERCTPTNGNTELDLTILVAVITAVVLILVIVILSVIICKCRKAKNENTKETMPLNNV
ncbi:tissue factor [Pelodytes ibericus]